MSITGIIDTELFPKWKQYKENEMNITKSETKFEDLRIGDHVRVVSEGVDFTFFRTTETGIITAIHPSNRNLPIIVAFDDPMVYQDGHEKKSHNFAPDNLEKIKPLYVMCPFCRLAMEEQENGTFVCEECKLLLSRRTCYTCV